MQRALFALAAGVVLSHGTARGEEASTAPHSVSGVSFYDAAAPIPESQLFASGADRFQQHEAGGEYRRPTIAIRAPQSAMDTTPKWLREQAVDVNQDWSVRLDRHLTLVRRF